MRANCLGIASSGSFGLGQPSCSALSSPLTLQTHPDTLRPGIDQVPVFFGEDPYMDQKAFLLLASSVCLSVTLLAETKYGRHAIEVKGKSPQRLRWEQVSRVYGEFSTEYRSESTRLRVKTHDYFHGKWDEYFPLLSEETMALLREDFPLLIEGNLLKSVFTFEDVFGLGDCPADLLFPLVPGLRKAIPMSSLRGLMLRGKNGEEKGIIQERQPGTAVFNHIVAAEFVVLDGKGELQETFGFSRDALTVRWHDISDRVLQSGDSVSARPAVRKPVLKSNRNQQ